MGNGIFIVSGEESGDLHGSTLMRALKEMDPSVRIGGMGGARMREEGLKGRDSREVSVVGVVEVVEKLPHILKRFRELKADLAAGEFDALVLIDFPDFNLRFAEDAKKLGIPVIYYISPQVWAWRRGRIKKIARLVDKMLVAFPFEEDLYKKAGVDVEYVGHPLAGTVKCELTKDEARASLGLARQGTFVALLPGSRTGEIRRLLPPLLKAAAILSEELGERPTFLLPAARSIDDSFIKGFLKDNPLEIRIIRNDMYRLLRASDAAAVTSGTATLETALIGTPMALVYRMSPLSYGIAKALVGIKHAGLPNIIAGKEVVRELIQADATPEKIARELWDLLTNRLRRERMARDFNAIRKNLGDGGAPKKAARAILDIARKRKQARGLKP